MNILNPLPFRKLAMAAAWVVTLFLLVACQPASAPSPRPSPSPSPTGKPSVPYTVNVSSKPDIGNYLVDAKGMTLYYVTRDAPGKSNITVPVLNNWPIFYFEGGALPPSLNASDFGTIVRDDGKEQSTYRRWPLYYYINDKAPGDTNGNGVGGVWFVIDPANFPLAVTATPAPSPSAAPSVSPAVSPPATRPPASPTAAPTAAPTAVPAATEAAVTLKGFAFAPSALTVKTGATVVWTNLDPTSHTATSDTGVFNGPMAAGGDFRFTFTQPGTYPYHCNIHPSMTATIAVQ